MEEKIKNLDIAILYFAIGDVNGQDLIDLAAHCLENGYDSPSLRILAGETDSNISNIDPLFTNAVMELGKTFPASSNEAVFLLARIIAEKIISGQIAPFEGAKKISQLDNSFEAPDYINEFERLATLYEVIVEDNEHLDKSTAEANLKPLLKQITDKAQSFLSLK